MSSSDLILTPCYRTTDLIGPVLLHQGRIYVRQKGQVISGDGRVELVRSPYPSVRFSVGVDLLQELSFDEDTEVGIDSGGPFFSSLPTHIHGTLDGKTFETVLTEPMDVGAAVEFDSIMFHVINCPGYYGSWVKTHNSNEWSGGAYRLLLVADPWTVTIDAIPEERKREREERDDGYFITSCGQLERSDGKRFNRAEALSALDEVGTFLSFVAGWWVSCCLPYGVDGSATWNRWAVSRVSRRASGFGWSDDQSDSHELNSAYTGYRTLRDTPLWRDVIDEVVYWYVLARQTPDISPAIVMQQTGLEQIGWVHLVEDRRALSASGFNDLWASDKLRILLTTMGIETSLPPHFEALAKAAPNGKAWEDGPHAVSEFRNAAVHPSPKKKALRRAGDALMEAQFLSLWYLERALLKLLHYEGNYTNRIGHFNREKLP